MEKAFNMLSSEMPSRERERVRSLGGQRGWLQPFPGDCIGTRVACKGREGGGDGGGLPVSRALERICLRATR